MKREIHLLLALTFIASAFILTAGVADADSSTEYTESMATFLPVVQDWIEEVQLTAHTAAVKPDPERLAALDALSVRGAYMLDDWRGTAAIAPAPLRIAHWRVADALGSIVTAAETAEEDPVHAAATIDDMLTWSDSAFDTISTYVARSGIVNSGNDTVLELAAK